MKKKLIIIISVVAVLIVSAVAVYFVSMLSDTPSPEAEQEENEARTVVYSDDATLFNSLTVENEHGSYTLVRDGDSIVIEGREQIPLLSASSTSMFETFADVYVVRTISEDSTEGFGFDSPSAVLTVKKADGSEKTISRRIPKDADICVSREKAQFILWTPTVPRDISRINLFSIPKQSQNILPLMRWSLFRS